MSIKVFGHKAPDTDAICSAIIGAWILTEKNKPATPYRLGEINKETEFVLNTFGLPVPELLTQPLSSQDTVVIVDTNNTEELPDGIYNAEIYGIIDHHKLTGTITTAKPIVCIMKPVASTGSILCSEYLKDMKPPREILGLALSCIISDTLGFRSPTTTQEDKKIAKKIAEKIKVDIKDLAKKMFAAKSDISHMTPEDLILADSKVFTIKNKKMRISVWETTNTKAILEQKEDILKASQKIKTEENLEYVLFFAVDILQKSATLIAHDSAKELTQKVWGDVKNNALVIPDVVSRKKQIIPAIEAAL